MKYKFTRRAKQEYQYWKATDPEKVRKIKELLHNALETPFEGLGHPEPLRGDHAGYWSRRIDWEHRFVYRVFGEGENKTLEIIQLRYHY